MEHAVEAFATTDLPVRAADLAAGLDDFVGKRPVEDLRQGP